MKPSVHKILTKLGKEKVELGLAENVERKYNKIKNDADSLSMIIRKAAQDIDEVSDKAKNIIREIDNTDKDVKKLTQAADDLGVGLPSGTEIAVRQLQVYKNDLKQLTSKASKASNDLFSLLG